MMTIEEQIRTAHLDFKGRKNANGCEISDAAQSLIKALIKVDPCERLPLDKCLVHHWVSATGEGGCVNRLLKLATEADPRNNEVRIRLPTRPSKEQVDMLRRDLHTWMTKFHCSALLKEGEIIATLGDEAKLGSEHIARARSELHQIAEFNCQVGSAGAVAAAAPRAGRTNGYPRQLASVREEGGKGGGRFRLKNYSLRVDQKHGAGLDLQPEDGGMRVETVCAVPGQPGLQAGDLITKINEVSLRGTPEHVEIIFGAHFCDGAQVAVRREIGGAAHPA